MGEWPSTGIYVSRDVKVQSNVRKESRKMLLTLRCICLLMCMIGTLQMVVESYSLNINVKSIILGLTVDCLLMGIGWIGKGPWKNVSYVWILGVFLICIFQIKKIINGYLAIENCVFNQLDQYYGISLPMKTLSIENENGELALFLFFTLLLWIIGEQVVYQGSIYTLTIIMILLFTLELLCGSRFEGIGLYLVFGSIFSLNIMRYRKGGRNWNVLYQAGILSIGILTSVSLVIVLTAAPILLRNAKEWNVIVYESINKKIDEISAIANNQNGWFGDHAPTADGSLNNRSVEQDGSIDLMVTTNEMPKQNMYLRGFIADTYEGTYWHRSSKEEFQEAMPQEDADYLTQNILYRYISNQAGDQSNTVTVQRVHASGTYGYVPYGFEIPDNQNLYGDTYYVSDSKENTYSGYLNWQQWVNSVPATESESELEEEYQLYAENQYLKIPINGLERLKAYCARKKFQTVQEAIDFVVQDVKNGRIYSMELDSVPEGEDFTEYFFFEQKKGYCIHFATTAALMLRMYGVPARYATGYVVSPGAFVQEGDTYVAEVQDSQAHAWVEVYRKGKGWIPLEVTPGYEAGDVIAGYTPVTENQLTPTEELENAKEEIASESDQEITELEEAQDSQDIQDLDKEGKTDSEPGIDNKFKSYVLQTIEVFFYTLFLICLVWAGVLVNRKHIIKKRKQLYFQKDINQGICEISYGLHQILIDVQKKRILENVVQIDHLNDLQYAKMIEEKLDFVGSGEYEAFINIVQEAMFGQETLNVKERKKCYDFYRKVNRGLWRKMDKKDKLWWKYVKCYEVL